MRYLLGVALSLGAHVACAGDRLLDLTLSVRGSSLEVRAGDELQPIVVHRLPVNQRPYIHPLRLPGYSTSITQLSPDHHPHQTGLYWGLVRLNDRDYFHNRGASHWSRLGAEIITSQGAHVTWRIRYALLDFWGRTVMTETQNWTATQVTRSALMLELHWQGTAGDDLTVRQWPYGGLFLRMPWRPGAVGRALDSNGEVGFLTNGQAANWIQVGLTFEDDFAQPSITLFDHPENDGHPVLWRLDRQMGVGPAFAGQGDLALSAGQRTERRYAVWVNQEPESPRSLSERWRRYAERPPGEPHSAGGSFQDGPK